MKIVVAGGCNKADLLTESLLKRKYEVAVINDEEAYYRYLSEKYNIPATVRSPCKRYVLEKAEIDHADTLIALRPGDSDNLVVYQTAKKVLHVRRAAAAVSNPRNVSVFKKLGVNTVISATYTIAKIIEQASTIGNPINSLSIEQENIVSSEPLLIGKCVVVSKRPKELSLSKNVIICRILHDVDVIVLNGETILQEYGKPLLPCPTVLQECVLDTLTVRGLAS